VENACRTANVKLFANRVEQSTLAACQNVERHALAMMNAPPAATSVSMAYVQPRNNTNPFIELQK
jgi:hypothetical protein